MGILIEICRKFNIVLSKHQKIRIAELIIIMIIGGLLETLSVTVILPFMQVVLDPSQVLDEPYVRSFCKIVGIESDRSFLVFLAILIALMYILKNLFLVFEYNVQYRFVFNNKFDLQQRLMHNVLHRPYQYFLGASSGEIMRLIHGDVDAAFDILVNILNLLTELIVSAMLITTILIMSPVITVFIATVLLILLIIIFRFVRPRQVKSGKIAQNAEAWKNSWLLQSVQGIKEIKVTRKEEFFEGKYRESGILANDSRRRSQILSLCPRYFIEAVSMAGMFLAVALMLYSGGDFEVIVPTLTVVAMAAVRILPSTNRISYTMSNIAFQKTYFDTFFDNIQNAESTDYNEKAKDKNNGADVIPEFNRTIEFEHISFKYDGSEACIFDQADMVIRKGESVGIVGGSGAGKTTSVDIILGLLIPQDGCVRIDGHDIRDDMNGWLSQVGYIPQMIFMLDGSIRDNIVFGNPVDDGTEEAVWKALKDASLEAFVKSLPDGLDTRIGERGVRLSGGQRQRIGIARALFNEPQVLIFDEATSALDNDTENSIMESIHSLHGVKTMIIIAHRLTTIDACDHIFRVENGKIVKER